MNTELLYRFDISNEAFDLLDQVFKYNSDQRITASQCLQHDYFRDVPASLKGMAAAGAQNRRALRNRAAVQAPNINQDLAPGIVTGASAITGQQADPQPGPA